MARRAAFARHRRRDFDQPAEHRSDRGLRLRQHLPAQLQRRYLQSPGEHQRWQARLLGRYELPFAGIGVGTNVRAQSGYPWSPVANIRLANAGTVNVFADDIDNRRSDTAGIVDLRVDKSFALSGGAKVTGMLDLYNLMNSNAVTNFFLTSGNTYNRIIAALNPRTMQLGVRVTF